MDPTGHQSLGAAAQAAREQRARAGESTGAIYTTGQGGNIAIVDPTARVNRPQSRVLDDQATQGRLDAILADQPPPLNAPEALLVVEEGQEPDSGLIGNIVNPAIDTGLGLMGQLERPFDFAGDVTGEWAGEQVFEGLDASPPSERTTTLRKLGHGGPSIAEGTRRDAADITREGVRTVTREGLKVATGAPIKRLSSGKRLTNAKAGKKKARPTHQHHTIPREVRKSRRTGESLLPEHLEDHPDIVGRRGNPNRWPVPDDEHIGRRGVHSPKREGGDFNTRWKEELQRLEERKPDLQTWTVKDVTTIRDRLTKEFDIERHRPKPR